MIGNVSDTGKELYENDSAGCYGRRRRPELQILVTENESKVQQRLYSGLNVLKGEIVFDI